ncbi:MAG TPA: hypothetical protein VF910_07645 [Candidatus Bathyarchaeia archaeon]
MSRSKIIRIIAKASFDADWQLVASHIEDILNGKWDNITFKVSYPTSRPVVTIGRKEGSGNREVGKEQ